MEDELTTARQESRAAGKRFDAALKQLKKTIGDTDDKYPLWNGDDRKTAAAKKTSKQKGAKATAEKK